MNMLKQLLTRFSTPIILIVLVLVGYFGYSGIQISKTYPEATEYPDSEIGYYRSFYSIYYKTRASGPGVAPYANRVNLEGDNYFSFRVIEGNIAEDKNDVFYAYQRLPGARYIRNRYAADADHVYYLKQGVREPKTVSFHNFGSFDFPNHDASPQTFYQGDGDTLARDHRYFYASGEGRHPIVVGRSLGQLKDIEILSDQYVTDGTTVWHVSDNVRLSTVFLALVELPNVSAGTFESLGHGFARDSRNVYYKTALVRELDPETVHIDTSSATVTVADADTGPVAVVSLTQLFPKIFVDHLYQSFGTKDTDVLPYEISINSVGKAQTTRTFKGAAIHLR